MPGEVAIWDEGTTPLAPGRMLIEASAGSGKTTAIAGIYLRLVMDVGVPVREILTMTFTRAATAELRDKIRERLRLARARLRSGVAADDRVAGPLLERGDASELRRAERRLRAALDDFDEARVLTIHSFCQGVLSDFAMESGGPFRCELVGDASEVCLEIAKDYWRRIIFGGSPVAAAVAGHLKLGPEVLADAYGDVAHHPDARVLPEREGGWRGALLGELLERAGEVAAGWVGARGEVEEILVKDPGLKRAKESWREDVVRATLERLEGMRVADDLTPARVGDLMRLGTGAIREATKKRAKREPPHHPYFELCEAFGVEVRRFGRAMRLAFLEEGGERMPAWNARRNAQTYDDLLVRVRAALREEGAGAALAGVLAKRYPAVLIDEFQDTDPAQYEILERIHRAGAGARLYLVGDPKQAIYGFRGGDIFTYLGARERIDRVIGLTRNWRSEPALVSAVNRLFGGCAAPFVFPGLEFEPATPGRGGEDGEPRLIDARPGAALRVVLAEGDGARNKDDCQRVISDHVVAELRRLLDGGATLGGRPVAPGDCAVLVRKNHEAVALHDRLRAAGIRAVLHSERSVFASPEAEEVGRLMDALLAPGDSGLVKAALAGPLFGWDWVRLAALGRDSEADWDAVASELREALERWEREGFLPMFRRLLGRPGCKARIVGEEGGERALTNLVHLAELLDGIEREEDLTPSASRARLEERVREEARSEEEHQLRLETDGNAVQVLTAHKSKGLQYPIVFCTHFWSAPRGARRKGDEIHLYHDGEGRLTCDFRDRSEIDPASLERAGAEMLSEELRLLYVGITRAMSRCYLYCAPHRGSAGSALSYLLRGGGGGSGGGDDLCGLARAWVGERADAAGREIDLVEAGEEDAGAAGAGAAGERAGAAEGEGVGGAREFAGRIVVAREVTSFSGMIRGAPEEGWEEPEVAPGEDDAGMAPRSSDGEEDRDGLPAARGPEVGILFHRVLERVDLSVPDDWDVVVREEVCAAGHDSEEWSGAVMRVLGEVASMRLPGLGGAVEFGRIPSGDQLREVEFVYPLRELRAGDLAGLFRAHWGEGEEAGDASDFPERLGRLTLDPRAGLLRGFIDVIFRWDDRYHVLDWKTNWLGGSGDAYGAGRLAREMGRGWYHLQAQLYALALDLHLRRRLVGYDPARHLGALHYVFVRGLDRGCPGRGIHWRPLRSGLLDALRRGLVAEPAPGWGACAAGGGDER